MSALSLSNARATLGGVDILKGVSFDVSHGKMIGLLGPNGAGKTTAVRALLGLQPLSAGHAFINGKSAAAMDPRERALSVSYLPQARRLAWPIGVREAVALGRFAFGGALGRLGAKDAKAVDDALALCELTAFANRSVASLSGGELARVHIGRALCSGTNALIADEPIAALDPRHAFEVLALLKAQASAGVAVLVILHDLNLAARFCDEIILMDHGQVVTQGPPRTALSPQTLADVYGIAAAWDGDDLKIIGST